MYEYSLEVRSETNEREGMNDARLFHVVAPAPAHN